MTLPDVAKMSSFADEHMDEARALMAGPRDGPHARCLRSARGYTSARRYPRLT
jgi:hypothetical protein